MNVMSRALTPLEIGTIVTQVHTTVQSTLL